MTEKYLDIWTAGKLGVKPTELTRHSIDDYTVKQLRNVVTYTTANSSFYREKFKGFVPDGKDGGSGANGICSSEGDADFLKWFRSLPFTTSEELRRRGMDFLCVRPGDISRIVTLHTGGSTGQPKRIYFTEADQQLTVDYFQNGMQLLVDSSDKILILMPAAYPGSIGKLLSKGLMNFGAKTVEYGLPQMSPTMPEAENKAEAGRLLKLIEDERVTSIVALPTHMRMLAETAVACETGIAAGGTESAAGKWRLKNVLLSAEYVAEEDARFIESVFHCKVYEHYGMTEMGLGCAVSCGYGAGYHVRESDLYLEIIDPETGIPSEDGQMGEVVFTTLTRTGMPFIRYRTGDYSRWITEQCPCGSVLKRLDKVKPRDVIKGYLR